MTEERTDQTAGVAGPQVTPSAELPSEAEQAIAAEIERTRVELGETVEHLAAKAHIGARARRAVARLGQRAKHAVAGLRHKASHAVADARDRAGHSAAELNLPARARQYQVQLAAAAVVVALAALAARKLRR
jgi:hypothetical protein